MTKEEKVREEAEKLARELGDQEWEKGETKYALEAYEASGITAAELFEKARKLLEAEKVVLEWNDAYWTAQKLPTTDHDGRYEYGKGCDKCVRCRTLNELKKYEECVRTLLGWGEFSHPSFNPLFYRAAAVACLKMIKRMFPDWSKVSLVSKI